MRNSLLLNQRKFRLADRPITLADRTLTDQLVGDAKFSHDVAEAIYRLKLFEIRPPGKLLNLSPRYPPASRSTVHASATCSSDSEITGIPSTTSDSSAASAAFVVWLQLLLAISAIIP